MVTRETAVFDTSILPLFYAPEIALWFLRLSHIPCLQLPITETELLPFTVCNILKDIQTGKHSGYSNRNVNDIKQLQWAQKFGIKSTATIIV